MRRTEMRTGAVLLAIIITGCGSMESVPPTSKAPAAKVDEGGAKASHIRPAEHPVADTDEAILEAADTVATSAREERAKWSAKGFEEFERDVYKEPGPGGKYIVNGDTPVLDRKHLKEFYDLNVSKQPPPRKVELAVLTVGTANGLDAVWSSTQKRQLTYCVSSRFGSHQQQVISDMAAAAAEWEGCGDVKFSHVPAEDTRCDASNANVVFDVRPVNVNGEYLARAFFPNEPRAARNVLIDDSSFALSPPPAKLQLVGILRHELGHTLGFRHEHTRPQAGACFEDNDWRPLTSYDKFSVMHYPQCNGGGDWELKLTPRDQSGTACLYGAAAGFQPDTSICQPRTQPTAPVRPVTRVFRDQSVAKGQEKTYPPLSVRSGTPFEVQMTGRGRAPRDPDLYVRFDAAPSIPLRKWACRPYLTGPTETCALDVPAGTTQAFVMVHGFDASRYDLSVKHTLAGR